jgi:hypothetical protein
VVGVVSTRHLVTHPRAIVHEFGLACYARCVWRTVAAHRPVTFLECIDGSRVRACDEVVPARRQKLDESAVAVGSDA